MDPNIILIVVDSLRYDHVGPQNGRQSLTPEMDLLLAESIAFDQAISQGPSTRVAMSALMSSTYASMYGGQIRLQPGRPVIQAMLKDAGYTTAGVTSNLYLSEPFGWKRGFDYYDDCRPENVYHRKIWLRGFNQVAKLIGIPLGWPKSLPAELVFENADRFLRANQTPFFLWIHLMDVHWPYTIQKFSWNSKWRRKREADKRLRPRLVSRPPQISQNEHQSLLAEYREAVQYTDKYIGAYVKKLESDGLLQDSWLIIIADHGEEFLEHGQYFHHPTLHEELVHVPLIIRPPDNSSVKRGYRYAGQVRSIDLVPTFLDIAKASPLADAQLFGESLLPILCGETNEDRPALIESPENQTLALRCDGWKYIWHIESDQRLLFNLAEDAVEKNNLFDDNPSKASAMHEQLEKHLQMVREASQSTDGYEESEIDQEIIDRLRDLGYVE